MQDDKPTPSQSYLKGANSLTPSHTNLWERFGYEDRQKASNLNQEYSGGGGEGLVEMMLSFSEGKTWPKWNALFFAVCALIYCYMHSYSILGSVLTVGFSAFCGYAIIGIAVVGVALGIMFLMIYLFATIAGWLF
ncbi:MAG: hypothetical protein ACRBDL_04950 [Alphaproteobacteria bacterium]